MHYLVTGGCGFIGSHLTRLLLRKGHRVTVLDDLSSGLVSNLPDGVNFIQGDIRNAADIAAAAEGLDGCFHLAAIPSVERSLLEPEFTRSVNVDGTDTLFRFAAAHPFFPVVYASSAAVYGASRDEPLWAETAPAPISPYGEHKWDCEKLASHHFRTSGVASIGLRFFNIYGPGQNPASPYSGVISIFLQRLAEGKPLTIHGDGRQSRDFVYVSDCVEGLLLAMDTLQQSDRLICDVMNIASGDSCSLLELAQLAAEVTGTTPELLFQPARAGDIRHSVGYPVKAKDVIGFTARTPLKDGLLATHRGSVPIPLPKRERATQDA